MVRLRSTGDGTACRGGGLIGLLALLVSPALRAGDGEALHARIDRLVESAAVGTPAAVAGDAEFVRRIHLDLTGRIPSSREARAFLEDRAPDKRTRLIDRLLSSPSHFRQLAVVFDVMIMERRPDKHVKTDEWRAWLSAFFAANRPYNELAREVLGAEGLDPAQRPAAKFLLDRDVSPDAITRDVGRIFYGMDFQCTQCHDHPRIDDYDQRHYYGLYAFVSRAYVFQPDGKKPAVMAEKGEGDVKFKSVFTKAEGATRPRIPDGPELDEPAFAKGEEYQVKPDPKDKNLRPVPKHSRRAQLAKLAGEGAGRAFGRNIANRLWAHMMGRGLVEPVDLHHSDNPPIHPELLETLAESFAGMKYDVRAFLRELALTRTYQRSIEMPARLAEEARASAARLGALEGEAKRLEEAAAKAEEAVRKAGEEVEAARKALAPIAEDLAKAEAAVAEARKAHDAAAQAAEAARKDLAAREDLRKAVSEAASKASEAAARLKDDADLAQSAAVFRARAERMAGEVDAASKDAATKTAAAAPKADQLAVAEKAGAAARARLAEAGGPVQALARKLLAAEERIRAEKIAAGHAARRAADASTLAEYGTLHAAAVASAGTAKRLKAELAAARDAAAKVEDARKARDAARGPAEEARRALAAKEEAALAVAEAAAKAEAVEQRAGKDAELVAAAAKIKGKRDRMNAEVAELRKAAALKDGAFRQAEAQFAAAEAARGKIAALEAQVKPAAGQAVADQGRADEAFGKLTASWSGGFALGILAPLTPEQICWSMMEAAGLVDQQRAAAEADLAKKSPPLPEAERPRYVEQFVVDKLKANEAAFVKLFGGAPGQPQNEFYATVDQALFFANGGLVRGWLGAAGGSLADRLMKTADARELARELYLSVLTRLPSDAEADEVAQYLAARPQAKLAAVQELVWAMLTSVEFRFKH